MTSAVLSQSKAAICLTSLLRRIAVILGPSSFSLMYFQLPVAFRGLQIWTWDQCLVLRMYTPNQSRSFPPPNLGPPQSPSGVPAHLCDGLKGYLAASQSLYQRQFVGRNDLNISICYFCEVVSGSRCSSACILKTICSATASDSLYAAVAEAAQAASSLLNVTLLGTLPISAPDGEGSQTEQLSDAIRNSRGVLATFHNLARTKPLYDEINEQRVPILTYNNGFVSSGIMTEGPRYLPMTLQSAQRILQDLIMSDGPDGVLCGIPELCDSLLLAMDVVVTMSSPPKYVTSIGLSPSIIGYLSRGQMIGAVDTAPYATGFLTMFHTALQIETTTNAATRNITIGQTIRTWGCPPGFRYNARGSMYQTFPSGLTVFGDVCTPCDSDTFAYKANSLQCQLCPLGTYNNYTAAVGCQGCDDGHGADKPSCIRRLDRLAPTPGHSQSQPRPIRRRYHLKFYGRHFSVAAAMGFDYLQICVLVKGFRLYKIFNNTRLRSLALTVDYLAKQLVVILAFEWILLAGWTIMSPPTKTLVLHTDQQLYAYISWASYNILVCATLALSVGYLNIENDFRWGVVFTATVGAAISLPIILFAMRLRKAYQARKLMASDEESAHSDGLPSPMSPEQWSFPSKSVQKKETYGRTPACQAYVDRDVSVAAYKGRLVSTWAASTANLIVLPRGEGAWVILTPNDSMVGTKVDKQTPSFNATCYWLLAVTRRNAESHFLLAQRDLA
ncbi:hypothetical protein DFJ77DRAFT_442905 [Powellomyces hirtus]|nr:hypothetical protein DFJ77DRAFT_442905 [Powellomyces hirtus]